jgi:hypothetical protein
MTEKVQGRLLPMVYARDIEGGWHGRCQVLSVQAFNGQLCLSLRPDDDSFPWADFFAPKHSQPEMLHLSLWALQHGRGVWVVLSGTAGGCQIVQLGVTPATTPQRMP